MTETISVDDYQKLIKQPTRSKYNNRKVTAEGYTFDSVAEYEYFCGLKLRLRVGQIKDLQVHPSFTLMHGFRNSERQWVRPITYEADFSYSENGQQVIVDVKGVRTEVFNIKWKLLQSINRDARFVLHMVERKSKR